MAAYQVGDGNTDSDGMNVFPSGAYGGFFGTTPAVQQASTNKAAVVTTASVSTTSNIWGFSTSSQANNLVTMVNDIYKALTTYGLLSS